MLRKIWKFLFAQKKPCNDCVHLHFTDPQNTPWCPLNEHVFFEHKYPDRFTCEYWNMSLEEIKAL